MIAERARALTPFIKQWRVVLRMAEAALLSLGQGLRGWPNQFGSAALPSSRQLSCRRLAHTGAIEAIATTALRNTQQAAPNRALKGGSHRAGRTQERYAIALL